MAFTLVEGNAGVCAITRHTSVNSYLLPYQWLDYGIESGFLQIEDLSFYDSLQGSLYAWAKHEGIPTSYQVQLRNGSFVTVPLWLRTEGEGLVQRAGIPLIDSESDDYICKTFDMEFCKLPVTFIGIDGLAEKSPYEQKSVNNGLIQLMKGCHLKLVHSVWFVN
jgi:hypothetical protein